MQDGVNHKNRIAKIEAIADRVLEILLYISCLFPFTKWITTWHTGTDSQPYAFIISIVVVMYYYLIKKDHVLPKAIALLVWCVFFVGAYAAVDMVAGGVIFVAKKYVTYLSLVSIPLAFYYAQKTRGGMWEGIIKLSIWIWLGAGIIQRWIDPEFASGIVIRQTTDSARGVVSFATEPSTYGYFCFFVLLLALRFKKNKWLYSLLLLAQILVLAQSTVSLIYIIVYMVGYAINEIVEEKYKALPKYAGIIIAGAILSVIAYWKKLLPYRMYQIITFAIHKDWDGLLKDGSIEKRLESVSGALCRVVNNLGLPQGFMGKRYFSGNGILLVEGGLISVLIIILLLQIIWKAYPKMVRIMYVFGFAMIMFSAIPYSCPIIGVYLGICCFDSTEIHFDEALHVILKKWKCLLVLASVLILISSAIRIAENAWKNQPNYQPILIENRNWTKEEVIKQLSEEEFQQVQRAMYCWSIVNNAASGIPVGETIVDKAAAEEELVSYEVKFSYLQLRLCNIYICEYLGQDLSEYLQIDIDTQTQRTGAENIIFFEIIFGFFGSVSVLGMTICNKKEDNKQWIKV